MSRVGLHLAWRRVGAHVAVAVLLVVVAWWWLTMVALGTPSDWASDFRQFWQGGRDVWNGVSPYPSLALLEDAGADLDPVGIHPVSRFPYPAGAAVALAPLGALGFDLAAAVWGALLIAATLAAVWILGVRDWRVLAVVVSSPPVITSVRLGTLTPVLLLLLAVAWRWRTSRWVPGGAIALSMALKLFLWPAVVWLAATRRYREAGVAVAGAAALTVGAWAVIGFDGMADYPELLRRLSDVFADRGFSLIAAGEVFGLPEQAAEALPWTVGLALLAWAVWLARGEDGDRTALSVTVVAAIALSPIVWLHSFALLVAPLAVRWPRFAWPWLLLWVFWLVPGQTSDGALWNVLVVLGATAAVISASLAARTRETAT